MKAEKLVPFTDEFDWCEEGVLVFVKGVGERYAVRAKGNQVWTVDEGKKLCEINYSHELSTRKRSDCQKVIHETHRLLTNREFAEFMQDHKGAWMFENTSVVQHEIKNYGCGFDDKAPEWKLLFRFRGTEEWHPVTTELYEIAKGINV
jgi:hypothetical protein